MTDELDRDWRDPLALAVKTAASVVPYWRSAVRGIGGFYPYNRVCIIDGEAKYYREDGEQ